MPKNLVIGNWKMNTNIESGVILFNEIVDLLTEAKLNDVEVVICPPATHLYALDLMIDEIPESLEIYLGAQDCSANKSGAYTGEISAEQLAQSGAAFVIIGHSERRKYHQESDVILLNKIDEALASMLNVIYCIGESDEQRAAGTYKDIIKAQMDLVLNSYSKEEFNNFIIAYEPVWAIGTGNTATPEQAQEVHALIRQLITDKFGKEIAEQTHIIYGGSCNAGNAAAIFSQDDIDGGLIGSSSLLAEEFYRIVHIANSVR